MGILGVFGGSGVLEGLARFGGVPGLRGSLTLGADAAQVGDFEQHPRESLRLPRAPAPGVDPQRLQQRLLQPLHPPGLLQLHPVWGEGETPG